MAYLSNLAKVAKRTGYPVKEVRGWESRGHGSFDSVESVVCHHTAGPRSGNMPSLNVVTRGRPGLSGPLCNYALGRDGTIYVVAAGVAWHAGRVTSSTYSNSHAIGIEAENTGLSNDQPWPGAQMDAYAKLCKELAKEFGFSVSRVRGHKEVCSPPGRKIDPTFDMDKFRRRVKNATSGSATPAKSTTGGIKGMAHRYYYIKKQDVPANERKTLTLDKGKRDGYALGADMEFVATVSVELKGFQGRGQLRFYQYDPKKNEVFYWYDPVEFQATPGATFVHATQAGTVTHGRHLRVAIGGGSEALAVESGRVDMLFS